MRESLRQPASRTPAGAGFTLIELLIGMSITTLVMSAAGALLLAVSSNWRAGDDAQALRLTMHQASLRAQGAIRPARWIGYVRAGTNTQTLPGGGIIQWKADRNGDGVIQLGEVAWLEHDPVARTLLFYEPIPRSQMTTAQQAYADQAISLVTLNSSGFPDQFKSLDMLNMLLVRTLASDVTGAKFVKRTPTAGEKPSVEMVLRYERNARKDADYVTATLRHPGGQPL